MRHVRLTLAVVIAAVFVAACTSQSGSKPAAAPPAGPAAAASAPLSDRSVPAQLQFNAKTVDGKDFSGHSLLGKPAVLWF